MGYKYEQPMMDAHNDEYSYILDVHVRLKVTKSVLPVYSLIKIGSCWETGGVFFK